MYEVKASSPIISLCHPCPFTLLTLATRVLLLPIHRVQLWPSKVKNVPKNFCEAANCNNVGVVRMTTPDLFYARTFCNKSTLLLARAKMVFCVSMKGKDYFRFLFLSLSISNTDILESLSLSYTWKRRNSTKKICLDDIDENDVAELRSHSDTCFLSLFSLSESVFDADVVE